MQPLTITLSGHLTADALRSELARVEKRLGAARASLIIDSRQMTGYDDAARALFVDWNARRKSQILRVAIVTDKLLWRMVIRTMSLASKQDMAPFADYEQALRWTSIVQHGEGKNTIKVTVGRLMEVRLYCLSASDIEEFVPAITKARLQAISDGVVAIVDMRPTAAITPEFVDRATQLMQRWNLGVVRVAILLPTKAPSAAAQIGGMLRAANNPNRRLFADAADAAGWLGEVLTASERKRLTEFIGEG